MLAESHGLRSPDHKPRLTNCSASLREQYKIFARARLISIAINAKYLTWLSCNLINIFFGVASPIGRMNRLSTHPSTRIQTGSRIVIPSTRLTFLKEGLLPWLLAWHPLFP